MFRCSLVGADRPPKEAMPLPGRNICALVSFAGSEGSAHFPPGQGTFREIGVQFWRKVDVAGYTPPFFGHGRVKVGVDQSAVSVSRCK